MGWPRRWHVPGLIYHIIIRGNNRQAVFLEEEDYRRYLSYLYHYKRKYCFKIFAFCLMTNHVHLLIKVYSVRISKIMQSLTISHTKHYHFKYRCCGHVWQGRFKSPIVSDDEYLLTTMAYIEQNPLRAKMVQRIGDYFWSSYKMNIGRREYKLIDRKENPAWLNLGMDNEERIRKYKDYLAQRIVEDKTKEIQRGTQGQGNYFSKKFEEQMRELLPKKRKRGRPRKTDFSINQLM